jgi:hypothetical protein
MIQTDPIHSVRCEALWVLANVVNIANRSQASASSVTSNMLDETTRKILLYESF